MFQENPEKRKTKLIYGYDNNGTTAYVANISNEYPAFGKNLKQRHKAFPHKFYLLGFPPIQKVAFHAHKYRPSLQNNVISFWNTC